MEAIPPAAADLSDFGAFADLVYGFVIALAIATPRPLAIFAVLPLTGRLGLPPFFRNVIVIAISLPIVIPLQLQIKAAPTIPIASLFALSLKEVFIGLLIGLVLGIPFWAIETAGNIVDFVRQAPDSELQDAQGTTEASITGTLFSVVATYYYVTIGGITLLINSIYISYTIWPPLAPLPTLDPSATLRILALLDALFRSALMIAAPLVIFIMISLLLLMIIARITPQINVFDLSMSFRNIAFIVVMQVYAVFIIDYFGAEISGLRNAMDVVKGLLP